MVLVFVLKMLKRLPRLPQNVLLPGEQPFPEILPLALVHRVLCPTVGRFFLLALACTATPILKTTLESPPLEGELISGETGADNIEIGEAFTPNRRPPGTDRTSRAQLPRVS